MSETIPPVFGTVPHSSNAIYDSVVDDEPFDNVKFTPDDTEESPQQEYDSPYDEFLHADGPDPAEVGAAMLDRKPRSPKAKKYEGKVRGLFSTAVKVTVQSERTVADSAALLMYGPNLAEKMGDLADADERVARAIDLITDQTESPVAAAVVAAAPLCFQIIRNHEPVVENNKPARTLHIPFTKRSLRFKVGIRLGKRMRGFTEEPRVLAAKVFSNPDIQSALRKQGINVTVG